MAFFVRYATEEDAETVFGIVQAAFAEYIDTIAVPPGALGDTLESTRREVAEGRTIIISIGSTGDAAIEGLFAEAVSSLFKATQPVGTARYEARPGYLYVGRVAVLPEWRGHGVGRALMRQMEEIALRLGLSRIRLGTRASMPSNLAFYEQLGYRAVAREPHPRGPDINVWFEKELEGVDSPESLQQEVVAALQPALGKVLRQVRYWCLGADTVPEPTTGHFHIGGEIELQLEGVGSLYISWDSIRGWGGYFSIRVRSEPWFNRDGVTAFDANSTWLWQPLIGTTLRSVEIMGREGVPYVIRFGFDAGNIYIGTGTEGFGAVDETAVCSEGIWQAKQSEWVSNLPEVLVHLKAAEDVTGAESE